WASPPHSAYLGAASSSCFLLTKASNRSNDAPSSALINKLWFEFLLIQLLLFHSLSGMGMNVLAVKLLGWASSLTTPEIIKRVVSTLTVLPMSSDSGVLGKYSLALLSVRTILLGALNAVLGFPATH